ncbi:MAG: hypothetical protein QXJ59_07140 [Thermofilaceae archaeon]
MAMERQTVVVGHFDVHGVAATALAAKAFGAAEVYANYPQTSPENLVSTLQNLYAASPSSLRIIIVDVPVDLKNPMAFIRGLEDLATRHEVIFIDHHESSIQFLPQFNRVKPIFLGPSALTLNEYLLSRIPSPSEHDRTLAVVGAVGDRDPEIVKRGLLTPELQELADGLDVLVREKDGALRVARDLLSMPAAILERARARAREIPAAQLGRKIGPVAIAAGVLPEQWGPKSLEKMAFASGAWYAAGVSYVSRQNQWVVRAIIRWDIAARMPQLPTPGAVAKELWPTRNIIGHPAAPSVATVSEDEARMVVEQWAKAIADRATFAASPRVTTLISETSVGEMLVEILQRLERLAEQQTKMYEEYLELKRRQVELLERTSGTSRRYD